MTNKIYTCNERLIGKFERINEFKTENIIKYRDRFSKAKIEIYSKSSRRKTTN